MDETVDIILFLEIIQSEGCLEIWEDNINGEIIRHYLSLNGNRRVIIYCGDEYMSHSTAKGLLLQLGLGDLIERMFPVKDDTMIQDGGEDKITSDVAD